MKVRLEERRGEEEWRKGEMEGRSNRQMGSLRKGLREGGKKA